MAKWNTVPPEDGGPLHGVLCTFKNKQGQIWVSEGWAMHGEMMINAIAWTPKPEHCTRVREGWLSQYAGDEFPKKSGHYLVSTVKPWDYNMPAGVKILWYNDKKQTFGGADYHLAWMPLPKPYKGSP